VAEFKDRLKHLRTSKNITQKALAEHLEITIRAYQHYETGTRFPDFMGLQKLVDFFNVPTDYLLGRDGFLRTNDGGFWVEVPPDIFAKSDKELAEMRKRAKKAAKKKPAIRLKAEPGTSGVDWGDDEDELDEE